MKLLYMVFGVHHIWLLPDTPVFMKLMFRIIVSGIKRKGGCKHFEDCTFIKFEEKDNFFAVFDGHCGEGAARYTHDNLWDNIKNTKGFFCYKKLGNSLPISPASHFPY